MQSDSDIMQDVFTFYFLYKQQGKLKLKKAKIFLTLVSKLILYGVTHAM